MMIVSPKEGERIALFAEPFDPPHIGHVSVCTWLLYNDHADRVLVIPRYVPMADSEPTPFAHRYRMCLFTFERFGKQVEVLNVEKKLGKPGTPVHAIELLQRQFPLVRLSFVIRDDLETEQNNWQDLDRIKSLVPLIAIPRGKDSPIPEVSSSDIRSRAQSGRSFAGLVSPAVAVYIITKQLYLAGKES